MIIAFLQVLFGICIILFLASNARIMGASDRAHWFDIIAGFVIPPYVWIITANDAGVRFGLRAGWRIAAIVLGIVALLMSISVALGLGVEYIIVRWAVALFWFLTPAALLYGKLQPRSKDPA